MASGDDGQHRDLEYEECEKESEVTPEKPRNLRLDCGTSELERRNIAARYPAPGVRKREEDFEKRIRDY